MRHLLAVDGFWERKSQFSLKVCSLAGQPGNRGGCYPSPPPAERERERENEWTQVLKAIWEEHKELGG